MWTGETQNIKGYKHTDVVAKTMSKGDFERQEVILGFNHTCCGLLQDSSLRSFVDPALQNTYDWHHNILQGMGEF